MVEISEETHSILKEEIEVLKAQNRYSNISIRSFVDQAVSEKIERLYADI